MFGNSNIELFLLTIGIISLIIGLPTFLLGCNPTISDKCIGYNIFNGNVYKTAVYEKTCSKCAKKDNKENCERYDYYSCWDGYVYAHYVDNNNQTTSSCKLQTIESSNSEYSAEKSVEQYKIGENVNWYKRKGSSECESGSTVLTLWYVGIVFLSLTGLVIFIGLVGLGYQMIKQIPNYKIIDNYGKNQIINTIELTNKNDDIV